MLEAKGNRKIDIVVAIIGLVGVLGSAVLGATWFTPGLIRFDVFFPTKSVEILDDFVFVHFEGYREIGSGPPIEIYKSPYTEEAVEVFDKVRYVEHVWLRKTKGNYSIQLSSSGIVPEIKAIQPPLKNLRFETATSGSKVLSADLDLSQSPEARFSGNTPNPKTIYVYRNGYQGRKSWGGKNVKYPTGRLTFVYDFSTLPIWESLISKSPRACIKRVLESEPTDLSIRWENGVAIVEAYSLEPGDKVRVYWTWNRVSPDVDAFEPLKCKETI